MLAENEPLFFPLSFWFASPDLLIQVRRAEIDALDRLLAKHPPPGDLELDYVVRVAVVPTSG